MYAYITVLLHTLITVLLHVHITVLFHALIAVLHHITVLLQAIVTVLLHTLITGILHSLSKVLLHVFITALLHTLITPCYTVTVMFVLPETKVVIVMVMGDSKNPPYFDQQLYNLSVTEGSPYGYTIGFVRATRNAGTVVFFLPFLSQMNNVILH